MQALVLGLGVSGRAAAMLLAGEGARVTAVDEADGDALRAACAGLRAAGVDVRPGAGALPPGGFDLAVTSPGLPREHRWLAALRDRGVDPVPEFELGWSRLRSRVIAVTGTNGKSSVVKWMAEALCNAETTAVPCGNYGLPVCAVAARDRQPGWAVLELSSFQLEAAVRFRCEAGVLLNLLPNHLDRHPSFAAYAAAKARLFSRMGERDAAIVPAAELERVRPPGGGAGRWITFGPGGTFAFRGGRVWNGDAEVADVSGTWFDNEILGQNAAAALAALHAVGIDPRCAVAAARAFTPLPHRMETVAVRGGVRFVNDSKATTLSALSAALRMCGGRVRLIAGGLLKEPPDPIVKEVLAQRAAGVYLIGSATEKLFQAWSDSCPCRRCETLEKAVAAAAAEARPGEVVLLSPGGASFDQFSGYQARGDAFRALVRNLG